MSQYCTDWHPRTGAECGRPALYLVSINSPDVKIEVWKCEYHVRRYLRGIDGCDVKVEHVADFDALLRKYES
jgi:hypothetical protein